uniref:Uncharacterized protein n=1 Tax=Florenciella parvula TaxID=236787 RepID=A0A7S2D1F7_9STRA|mmetsp:Transcript_7946/g.16770  ORF Transcript_7946/g.16770 Transcript_7946/m.16770 type:complete len:231 (+) Transcript_7946:155-847(+)
MQGEGGEPLRPIEAERSSYFFEPPPRAAPAPYLERMAAMHEPIRSAAETPAPWSKVHTQPIAIPDLNHTGVRTEFTYNGETFLRPDGSVSLDLQNSIRSKVAALPKRPTHDTDDIQHIDLVRSIRRSNTLQHSAASVLKRQSLGQNMSQARLSDEEPAIEWNEGSADSVRSGASKKKGRARRLKKPYSGTSLLDCLLDLEYGSTSGSLAEKPFRWEISGFVNALDRDEDV